MKNNIKKAPVKFREDVLYFQHFYADFCLCPKLVIITTLKLKIISVSGSEPLLSTVLHEELSLLACILSILLRSYHKTCWYFNKSTLCHHFSCYAPLLECYRPALRYFGTGYPLCRPCFRQAVFENQVKQ